MRPQERNGHSRDSRVRDRKHLFGAFPENPYPGPHSSRVSILTLLMDINYQVFITKKCERIQMFKATTSLELFMTALRNFY
jgi:hypothetical protein